jgi:hypothetical protein
VSAGEIEEFLRSSLGNAEFDVASSNGSGDRFSLAWQKLHDATQLGLLRSVLKEVVFDPRDGAMTITLAENAATVVADRSK